MSVQTEIRWNLGLSQISGFLLATSEKEELPRVILVRAEIHQKSAGIILNANKYK